MTIARANADDSSTRAARPAVGAGFCEDRAVFSSTFPAAIHVNTARGAERNPEGFRECQKKNTNRPALCVNVGCATAPRNEPTLDTDLPDLSEDPAPIYFVDLGVLTDGAGSAREDKIHALPLDSCFDDVRVPSSPVDGVRVPGSRLIRQSITPGERGHAL